MYNHLEAKKHGELIIRILVLPNHLECCAKPIVDWIAKNLGSETRVNLMFQYRPEWKAFEVPELSRKLTRDEMQQSNSIGQGSESTKSHHLNLSATAKAISQTILTS